MLTSSSNRIDDLRLLPVIKGYYLVLGGGKIGTSFTEHARKHSLSFVLVIDNDKDAPASSGTKLIKDASELRKLLEGKLISPLDKESSEIYFYCTGLDAVPFILSFGMPEYIVPAIPCHVAAYLVKEYLNINRREKQAVREMCITSEDEEMIRFFDQFISHFPENIIAALYPAQGIVMLAYARQGEICPDGCAGPERFCPNFRREKPKTITNYVQDVHFYTKGWVFESYQMKPGIGAMKGADMKHNLLEISEYVNSFDISGGKIARRVAEDIFFIATTCNCHGVVNLLRICSQREEKNFNKLATTNTTFNKRRILYK